MFEGRKANKCKRYNLPHTLNGGVQWQCVLQKHGIPSQSESQHTITLCNTTTLLSLSFLRNRLFLPTVQSKHKTASSVIGTPNIVLYCHQDKSPMTRQHLSVSLSQVPTPHKHSVMV